MARRIRGAEICICNHFRICARALVCTYNSQYSAIGTNMLVPRLEVSLHPTISAFYITETRKPKQVQYIKEIKQYSCRLINFCHSVTRVVNFSRYKI